MHSSYKFVKITKLLSLPEYLVWNPNSNSDLTMTQLRYFLACKQFKSEEQYEKLMKNMVLQALVIGHWGIFSMNFQA